MRHGKRFLALGLVVLGLVLSQAQRSSADLAGTIRVAVLGTMHATLTRQPHPDFPDTHTDIYPPIYWWSQRQDITWIDRQDIVSLRWGDLDLTSFDLIVVPPDWAHQIHSYDDWDRVATMYGLGDYGMPEYWDECGIDMDDLHRDWVREIVWAVGQGVSLLVLSDDHLAHTSPQGDYWEMHLGNIRDSSVPWFVGDDRNNPDDYEQHYSPRLHIYGQGKVLYADMVWHEHGGVTLYEDEFAWLFEDLPPRPVPQYRVNLPLVLNY